MIHTASLNSIREFCEKGAQLVTPENKNKSIIYQGRVNIILPTVRYALENNEDTLRRPCLQLLGHIVYAFKYLEDPALHCDLLLFVDKTNVENDLFECLTHLQIHRRARGLRKIKKIIRLYLNENISTEIIEDKMKKEIKKEELEIEEIEKKIQEEGKEYHGEEVGIEEEEDEEEKIKKEKGEEEGMTGLMKEAIDIVDDESQLVDEEEENNKNIEEDEDHNIIIDKNTVKLNNNYIIDCSKSLFIITHKVILLFLYYFILLRIPLKQIMTLSLIVLILLVLLIVFFLGLKHYSYSDI